MQHPSEGVLEFAKKVKAADGIIIVTPEYNGGYPASLKNAIDLLYVEWKLPTGRDCRCLFGPLWWQSGLDQPPIYPLENARLDHPRNVFRANGRQSLQCRWNSGG